MLQGVCSICGESVPTSDMQVEEALELLLAEDGDEDLDFSHVFGPILSHLISEEG